MKSKLKRSQIVYHIFLILIICGLICGFLFDLRAVLPFWIKTILSIVVIGYPIFVIYTILRIPLIELKENKITSKSLNSLTEIKYEDFKEVRPKKFLNKIYKIGSFYSIESKEGITINIPHKMYSNEDEIFNWIEEQNRDKRRS